MLTVVGPDDEAVLTVQLGLLTDDSFKVVFLEHKPRAVVTMPKRSYAADAWPYHIPCDDNGSWSMVDHDLDIFTGEYTLVYHFARP